MAQIYKVDPRIYEDFLTKREPTIQVEVAIESAIKSSIILEIEVQAMLAILIAKNLEFVYKDPDSSASKPIIISKVMAKEALNFLNIGQMQSMTSARAVLRDKEFEIRKTVAALHTRFIEYVRGACENSDKIEFVTYDLVKS